MEDIVWLGNWKPIRDTEYQLRLSVELRREIESNAGHVLYDQAVTFLAEWIGSREKDFVVFASPKNAFLTVHLTYSVEHDSRWPWSSIIGDRSQLLEFIELESGDREVID